MGNEWGADDARIAQASGMTMLLQQHGAEGRYANNQAGGEEAIEHQGLEFHGGSPRQVSVAFEIEMANGVPSLRAREKPHSQAIF